MRQSASIKGMLKVLYLLRIQDISTVAKDERIKMNRLKQVLAEKDITQTDLAKMVGKNSQTISRICNNSHQPTIKLLREIALALGVNVQELLVPTPIREE